MAINVNNGNGALAAYQYASKAQKTSAKGTTFAEKVAETGSTQELSEAEKLEAFKKEIWNEINSMPWNSSVSVSIQITDKAFERMMNDPDFKERMLTTIGKEAAAAHYPVTTSLTWIDENGYRGQSWNFGYGEDIYKMHSSDKNSFYSKKATNKSDSTDLTEYYEKQRREREFQQEMRDKEYFDHKRLTEYWNKRQSAAASYEANVVVEPVEGSGFDSAMAGTIV